ncbi:MAG: polysaccharide biosynthesis/export family protein [Sedimentisphaerales bacterium]|nr:polysaccharide biosynthesis/export family protein [Sedimentisphaerales bacterium]
MDSGVLGTLLIRMKMTAVRIATGRFTHGVYLLPVLLLVFLSGCGNKFFDPAQVGRFRPVPAVNVILDTLGVAEEVPVAWEGAEEPLPIDIVPKDTDYIIRAGDVVSIDIFELLRENIHHINNYVVTETGKISIPEVGVVQAAGLTEKQLEEQIKKIVSPSILKTPSITVMLVASQQRAFSVLGDGVQYPGRYSIPRYDFRLTDALATAGGSSQFNASHIYVSRFTRQGEPSPDLINPGYGELELEVIEPSNARRQFQSNRPAALQNRPQWPRSNVVITSSEMISNGELTQPYQFERYDNGQSRLYANNTQGRTLNRTATPQPTEPPPSVDEVLNILSERTRRGEQTTEPTTPAPTRRNVLQPSVAPARPPVTETPTSPTTEQAEIEWVFQNGKWIAVPKTPQPQVEPQQPPGHTEWIFKNGKWVPIQVGPAQPPVPTVEPMRPRPEAPEITWDQEEDKTRLIKIPADKLLAGDPRYNIVIKPGDSIFVPVDIIGEFYIMGNVNRTGPIPLTGRHMNLKQAIATAGGLGPLAWPQRCEIVRRIGREKEEIVLVDLDKIYSGEQPDFFIKPNDLINVGTHATSRWRAVLRNAFRATYGFGFVYDRNFADMDFVGATPITRQVLDWF